MPAPNSNHYMRLGLAPGTTFLQVQQRYYQLCAALDHNSTQSAPLRNLCVLIRGQLNESFSTISNQPVQPPPEPWRIHFWQIAAGVIGLIFIISIASYHPTPPPEPDTVTPESTPDSTTTTTTGTTDSGGSTSSSTDTRLQDLLDKRKALLDQRKEYWDQNQSLLDQSRAATDTDQSNDLLSQANDYSTKYVQTNEQVTQVEQQLRDLGWSGDQSTTQ
jgi:hypothetical protein